MRLIIYDGVRYSLTSSTEEAIGEFHRQLPNIKADIAAMRASQPLMQKSFHRMGNWDIKEHFGITTVMYHSKIDKPKKKQVIENPKKLTNTRYIPALDVYDRSGNFSGVLICESGTFEPTYKFIACSENSLDPFLWGQWQPYFETIPYTQREERVISEEFYGSTKKVTYSDIPSTNDTLAYWDWDTDEVIVEDGQYTDGPSFDYWHYIGLPTDPVYLFCTWARAESWNYWYAYSAISSYPLRLIDYETFSFISAPIEGGDITYDYSMEYDGTFTDSITAASGTTNPAEIEDKCAIAEEMVRTAAPRGPTHDGVTPVPIHYYPDSDCQFGSGSINDEQIGFIDWMDERVTAYQADMYGGTIGVSVDGGDVQYNSRTNGIYASGVTDYLRILLGTAVVMATYGVNSETYDDTREWTEGALVDGVFYSYRHGTGYYYYDWGDVQDAIEFDSPGYAHPRYWGSAVVTAPIFMSSGRRHDAGWVYFHVDTETGILTGTEFSYSHNIGAIGFHSITGFPDLFGKGHFRLVKVVEDSSEVETIEIL